MDMSFWLPFLAATAPEESVALLEESVEHLPVAGAVNPFGRWCLLSGFIEASAILGRNDHADLRLDLAQELLNTGASLIKTVHLVQKILAIAAMNAGDYEKAEESFEAALRQAEELPIEPERAEVKRWWAIMLDRRAGPGDRDRAGELRAEAKAIRGEPGMPESLI
jgi:tetratricopeptide (TPR) repeat protein